MANWKKKVIIKDLLETWDTSAAEVDELAEVQRILPLWKTRFDEVPELKHFTTSLMTVKTEAQFNRWLDGVYNYCDDKLIWLEGM
jgi:hypothetical protein